MKQGSDLPRIAFVVDLADTSPSEADKARLLHLLHLFTGHRLPATWIVDTAERARLMREQNTAPASGEVAFRIDMQRLSPLSSHLQFRAELGSQIATLSDASEADAQLLVGDPQLLRSRATILAELGIVGVFFDQQDRSTPAKPRPLPCGLWQLQPSICLPQKRRLANLLSRRQTSVKRLLALDTAETAILMVRSAELGRSGARALRGLEKLLREISWAASRDQLIVSTVGETLAELTSQRVVKPQRSILRVAA